MERLNKFLAGRLGLSRREADEEIEQGRVEVDGRVARIGDRVDKNSKVCYNGKIVPFQTVFTYLILSKPTGYVSSRRRQGEVPTLFELLPKKYQKLKTVGRLDKDSSGLILLTDDGDFAFEMTHPKFSKKKTYLVELERPLAPLHQQMIADFGVTLKDGRSQLGLERLDEGRRKWRVIMSEGRNRQIRRTFGAMGYRVVKLHRVSFGNYELRGLEQGGWREIKIGKLEN